MQQSLRYLVLNETHLARWGGNCHERLGDEDAIEKLITGLTAVIRQPNS